MPIEFHPRAGQLLLCDFSPGFKEPEMIKNKRPVIVLTKPFKRRHNLVTVIPLSTVTPEPIEDYHYLIPKKSLPQLARYQEKETWFKGDMLYTVGFHRLNLIKLGRRQDGKRLYYSNRLGREQMKIVYGCVLHGLGLASLIKYL